MQVIHQSVKQQDLTVNLGKPPLRRLVDPVAQGLQSAVDHSQRGAKLMGDIGNHPPPQFFGPLQTFCHPVEGLSQTGQFIFRLNLDRLFQVPPRDPLRGRGQLLQRSGELPE